MPRRPPLNARTLYIDLLKRALNNALYDPVDPTVRVDGRDWPSRACTMIGLKRLDNLHRISCNETRAEATLRYDAEE